MRTPFKEACLLYTSSETIAKRFVDYMDSDDAVDIIREMDEDKQEEVLSHLSLIHI